MKIETKKDFYRENPHCWTIITPHGSPTDFFEPAALKKDPPHTPPLPAKDKKFLCALKLSARFAPPERRLIVIPESRGTSALDMVRDRNCGAVLLYPEFAGTAASVFFALTRIISKDREATVIINPLEHWLPDEESIIKAVADAIQVVERIPQKIILLAGDSAPQDQNPLRIQPGQKYRQSLFPQLWTVRNLSNGADSAIQGRSRRLGCSIDPSSWPKRNSSGNWNSGACRKCCLPWPGCQTRKTGAARRHRRSILPSYTATAKDPGALQTTF